MQMCPMCDYVYDEAEYTHCPRCSGEIEEHGEEKIKHCPNCGGIMRWDGCWECWNCGDTINSSEDDYDSIMEY